jgi:hypothetical protein
VGGSSLAGGAVVVLLLANPGAHALDAIAYWSIDPANPYASAVGNLNAMDSIRYAPPFILVMLPAHALPWPVFITGWTILCLAALFYVSGRWALALAALYPVAMELSVGNVNLLIGAAVVVGFRWPRGVVVCPADESDAGRRPCLVRRQEGVAVARHRDRCDGGHRRRILPLEARRLVRLDPVPVVRHSTPVRRRPASAPANQVGSCSGSDHLGRPKQPALGPADRGRTIDSHPLPVDG